MHSGWYSHPEKLMDYKKRGFFIFAFIRNPWDKVVSIWAKIGKKLTLREFLDFLMKNEKKNHISRTDPVHYKAVPQEDWIVHDDKLMVDYLGRFESLYEDYRIICGKIGLSNPPALPHFNPGEHRPYKEYYDQECREIVAELYKKDIERFGYEF